MTILKAIEAGCDIVDTALSPMAEGTSQPATESLCATLKGTEYDPCLDMELMNECATHFRGVAARLEKDGWLVPSKVLRVDANTLKYQVPGGMLSNMIGQLKQFNAMDKYYDVLAEIPQVRKDFGYPPLVTPTSQIVGTQAVMNVLFGRYKTFPNESKGLLRGEYGKLPGSGERGSPQDGHWRRQGDYLPPGRSAQAGNGQVSRGNPRSGHLRGRRAQLRPVPEGRAEVL